MTTDELERLLVSSLHEGDALPVDSAAAERRLALRESERVPAARRWSLTMVAAAVVGLLVVASLALGNRLTDGRRDRPVAPGPRLLLSPSGLPVGVLEGLVGRRDEATGAETSGIVRLRVRADGSGQFSGGSIRDARGGGAYEVHYLPDGPGRALMQYTDGVCARPDALRLDFRVQASTLVIDRAQELGCLVPPDLAAALVGARLRIRPLAVELSPSGLPVGLLEGDVRRNDGNVDVSTFRLQVLPDGTGGLSMGGASHGSAAGGGGGRLGYPVGIAGAGPGQVVLSYEGPVCTDPRALTLTFTADERTVRIDEAVAAGCLVNADLVADLPGTVLRILPEQ